MSSEEIVLTYFLIGEPAQENRDFYFHDGMSILNSQGAKLDIWKGDCVLVKLANGEKGDRLCPVLVRGFTEQKVKSRKIKMHITWFYNKEDLLTLESVQSFPEFASIQHKELFLSDHDDIINVTTIDSVCTILFLPPTLKSLPPLPESTPFLEHVYFCRYFISTLKKKKMVSLVDSVLVARYHRFIVEVGKGACGEEELQRKIPAAVLKYLTSDECAQPFFVELSSTYTESVSEAASSINSEPERDTQEDEAGAKPVPPPSMIMDSEVSGASSPSSVPSYFEEVQVTRVDQHSESDSDLAEGDAGSVCEVSSQEETGDDNDHAATDEGVELDEDDCPLEIAEEDIGTSKRVFQDPQDVPDEKCEDETPAKRPRIDEEEAIAAEKEAQEEEPVVEVEQVPNDTVPSSALHLESSKRKVSTSSPPIFCPRQLTANMANGLETDSIDENRLRGGRGTSDTEDWDEEEESSTQDNSDSDYREGSQRVDSMLAPSLTTRHSPRQTTSRHPRRRDEAGEELSDAEEDAWWEKEAATIPPLLPALPSIPATELKGNLLFSPFDVEGEESSQKLEQFMKKDGRERVIAILQSFLAKHLPSPLCIEGSLIVLDRDIDAALLESYHNSHGQLSEALEQLDALITPFATVWSVEEQREIYKFYRDYNRYATDERRRRRLLGDLYFTLHTPNTEAEGTDDSLPSSSSPSSSAPKKTVMQIRSLVTVYLHSARSLRIAIGRLPTAPPAPIIPLDQMKQVLYFLPRFRIAMDELTCQQLLSSFLVYDQQFMSPLEFLVRTTRILMRGVVVEGEENVSHDLIRDLCHMLPVPLNKVVRFPFAEEREEDLSEEVKEGTGESKETTESI